MNEWPPIYVFWSNASRRVPFSAREGLFIKNQRSFAAKERWFLINNPSRQQEIERDFLFWTTTFLIGREAALRVGERGVRARPSPVCPSENVNRSNKLYSVLRTYWDRYCPLFDPQYITSFEKSLPCQAPVSQLLAATPLQSTDVSLFGPESAAQNLSETISFWRH